MISNVDKNIIMIKDIPSNMIEEAIFILKENVSDKMIDAKIELAKSESELFLQNYIDEEISDSLQKKFEEDKKIQNKNKKKTNGIIAAVLAIIFSVFVNKL